MSPETEERGQPPAKRPRVAVACQRCKTRKQKCDGDEPRCSNCQRSRSECHYVTSTMPRAAEQKLYLKALEDRVAELESTLSSYDGKVDVAEDHWKRPHDKEEVGQSLSNAIRDFSLNASGYYIGATSAFSLGKLLKAAALGQQHHSCSQYSDIRDENSRHEPVVSKSGAESGCQKTTQPTFAGDSVDKAFQLYIKHIAPQHPFIPSRKLRDLHERRESVSDIHERCLLHLIYAIGGRAMEWTGAGENFPSNEHYDAAMMKSEMLLGYCDRRCMIYLGLATIYCLRAPRRPGPWMLIGLAMKIGTALGLHRKMSNSGLGLQAELDKRLFWTCYALDLSINISLGRPPSISYRHIDVPLPLDINEEETALEAFQECRKRNTSLPASPTTSLTYSVHILRLKKIESRIQDTIYRVDISGSSAHTTINGFLDELRQWKEAIPSIGGQSRSKDVSPYLGPELYKIHYYRCVRLLLYPQLTEKVVDPHYLQLCAEACAGVCQSYRKLHDSRVVCYSPLTTQTLFLAGLTLIYCMWQDPEQNSTVFATTALTDCSIMLYIMTERWAAAQQFRDAFVSVKNSMLSNPRTKENSQAKRLPKEGNQGPRLAFETGDKEFLDENVADICQNMTSSSINLWDCREFNPEGTLGFDMTNPDGTWLESDYGNLQITDYLGAIPQVPFPWDVLDVPDCTTRES